LDWDFALQSSNMTHTGKLIALEGIDGSGKRTQLELLEQALSARGHSVYSTGFPQYDSWFGKIVGQFLDGVFGPLERVDPRFTAMLYAGDRFEAKPRLEAALELGKVVLCDRYIGSNLAHQTARMPATERADFLTWIEHLEYEIYDLPRETLVLYLRVPPHEAQSLVSRKSARSYTAEKQDLQEASLLHLQDAAEMYDMLSRRSPWATVQCFDPLRKSVRPPQEIAEEVLAAVLSVLPESAKKGAC
jgi:dTMP kinase